MRQRAAPNAATPLVKVELSRVSPRTVVTESPSLLAAPLLKVLGTGAWLDEGLLRRFFDTAVLMQQGDVEQAFMVVLCGEVRLFGRRDAEFAELGLAHPGDFLGESALLRPGESRTYSAVAQGQVDVLELSASALLSRGPLSDSLRALLLQTEERRRQRLHEMSDFLNRW
jgi:CRP-like cAMP-binding protein